MLISKLGDRKKTHFMPKKFDCEDEPNEFMEAPCKCDCGKWFDLEDGYRSDAQGKIVCRECKELENEER
jgi:hypothetical protein